MQIKSRHIDSNCNGNDKCLLSPLWLCAGLSLSLANVVSRWARGFLTMILRCTQQGNFEKKKIYWLQVLEITRQIWGHTVRLQWERECGGLSQAWGSAFRVSLGDQQRSLKQRSLWLCRAWLFIQWSGWQGVYLR